MEKYNNKTKIRLAKQIHGVDYAIILETVSKDRGSLHPQNVIGISEKQYNEKYNRGNAGSRRAVMDNATQPNTSPHTDYVSSTISNIPQASANSQEGNAAVSPESSVGAATRGFADNPNPGETV